MKGDDLFSGTNAAELANQSAILPSSDKSQEYNVQGSQQNTSECQNIYSLF